jgi:hypothetical protein
MARWSFVSKVLNLKALFRCRMARVLAFFLFLTPSGKQGEKELQEESGKERTSIFLFFSTV